MKKISGEKKDSTEKKTSSEKRRPRSGGDPKQESMADTQSQSEVMSMLSSKTTFKSKKEEKAFEEHLEYIRFPTIMGWYFDGSQFAQEPFAMNETYAVQFNILQEEMEVIHDLEHDETFTEMARRNFWPPKWLGCVFRTRGVYLDFKEIKRDPPRTPPEINFEHERQLITIYIEEEDEKSSDEDAGSIKIINEMDLEDGGSIKKKDKKAVQIRKSVVAHTDTDAGVGKKTGKKNQKNNPKSGGADTKEEVGADAPGKANRGKGQKKGGKGVPPPGSESAAPTIVSGAPAVPSQPASQLPEAEPKKLKPSLLKKGKNQPEEPIDADDSKVSWTDPNYKASDQRIKLDRPTKKGESMFDVSSKKKDSK